MPAPATPPVPPQVPVLASETSSDTSSYPTSCSPLLPFAFTPSAHSLASLPDHQVCLRSLLDSLMHHTLELT